MPYLDFKRLSPKYKAYMDGLWPNIRNRWSDMPPGYYQVKGTDAILKLIAFGRDGQCIMEQLTPADWKALPSYPPRYRQTEAGKTYRKDELQFIAELPDLYDPNYRPTMTAKEIGKHLTYEASTHSMLPFEFQHRYLDRLGRDVPFDQFVELAAKHGYGQTGTMQYVLDVDAPQEQQVEEAKAE